MPPVVVAADLPVYQEAWEAEPEQVMEEPVILTLLAEKAQRLIPDPVAEVAAEQTVKAETEAPELLL